MRSRSLILFCSFFTAATLSAASAAQDGGQTDGGVTDAGPPTDADAGTDAGTLPPPPPTGCGDLTITGECDGTMVRYCANDDVVEYDCATLYPDNPATCGTVSTEWGFDCLISTGEECIYSSDGNFVTTFCENDGACVVDPNANTSRCVASAGTNCLADLQGLAVNGHCIDDVALYACREAGTFAGLECSSGGECDDGRCVNTREGGACDSEGVTIACAQGLLCDENNECVSDPNAEPDPAPEAAPEDEPSCSSAVAANAGAPSSFFAVVALAALSLRRRKRCRASRVAATPL